MNCNLPVKMIGLMSGTSLDGLDLVCVTFSSSHGEITWEWVATDCIPYPEEWIEKLKTAPLLSSLDLLALDVDYGVYLGKKVNEFILKYHLKNIDAIASHGHTIFHSPEKGYTLQIGHGGHIHAQTQIPVVCDFRSQDVALGGQGAPLVPIGDQLLFSDYDACINLGGFANISFEHTQKQRFAFDICPVNYVLNYYASTLGLPYDSEGKIAEKGTIIPHLFQTLNNLSFYHQTGPKSLGREWVEKEIFILFEDKIHCTEDILATFTAHAATQISQVINRYHLQKILCSGGGALNAFLMNSIQRQTSANLVIADHRLLHYKEALIFALLGYLKLNNQTNILKTVTGALRDSCSGVVYN